MNTNQADAYRAWMAADRVINGTASLNDLPTQPPPIAPPRHTDANTIHETRRKAQTRNQPHTRYVRP